MANNNLSDSSNAIPNISREVTQHENKSLGDSNLALNNNNVENKKMTGQKVTFKNRNDVSRSPNNGPTKPPPKHLVPCPFLKKRDYCLKESKCDFLHHDSENYANEQSVQHSQFSIPSFQHLPPSNANQIAFSWNPNLFPPMHFPTSYPYLYPPPLMKIFNNGPTKPPRR